jgi:hypothetical protein
MEVIDNVISAYEAVKMNGVSQGIIALCSFIAVIIVIQKFVTAWKEAFSEGDKPVDMKQFFKLFYIYIYVFAIIMVAPFAFTIVETALGNLQNELISHYQESSILCFTVRPELISSNLIRFFESHSLYGNAPANSSFSIASL